MVNVTPLSRRRLMAATGLIMAAGCGRTEPSPAPQPIPPSTDEPRLVQGRSMPLDGVRIGFLHQLEGRASLTVAFDGDDSFESRLGFAPPRTIPVGGGWWMVEPRERIDGRAQLGFVPIDRTIPAPAPGHRLLFVGGSAHALGLSQLSLVQVDGGEALVERWTRPDVKPGEEGTRSVMRIGDVVQTAAFRYTVAAIHPQRDFVVGHLAFTVEAAAE